MEQASEQRTSIEARRLAEPNATHGGRRHLLRRGRGRGRERWWLNCLRRFYLRDTRLLPPLRFPHVAHTLRGERRDVGAGVLLLGLALWLAAPWQTPLFCEWCVVFLSVCLEFEWIAATVDRNSSTALSSTRRI